MIAIILPSRGLIFSQTADEILQNVKRVNQQGWETKIFFSHRKPIPDCFEIPTNEALKNPNITHLWFVEDDMVLPPNTLEDMLAMDLAVVTANYPTTDKKDAAILTIKNRIVYGGTGCLLVKKEVFDELKKPYFRSDIVWIPRNYGEYIKFTGMKKKNQEGYGYHDVNFYMNLYKLEIPVHKLPYTLAQRKLKELGKQGSNNGQHKIRVWKKVQEDRFFKLKELPIEETGNLIEILTPSGSVLAKRDHAEKLINAGLASPAPRKAVVIDDTEL
jgi:hypothetical protein